MTRTPEQAIALVAAQAANGPAFAVGLCKRKTREAYAVPSDGSGSAAQAWTRTKHRVTGSAPIRGALRWYLGGADGYGHVTIDDGKGGEWSVDIERGGYWGHVPVGTITARWPNLRYVGRSLDIDGVLVVVTPEPEAKPIVPRPTIKDLTVALDRLATASANPRARLLYRAARSAIAPLVASDLREKTPTTTAGVIAGLKAVLSESTGAIRRARLTAAIAFLRPMSPKRKA